MCPRKMRWMWMAAARCLRNWRRKARCRYARYAASILYTCRRFRKLRSLHASQPHQHHHRHHHHHRHQTTVATATATTAAAPGSDNTSRNEQRATITLITSTPQPHRQCRVCTTPHNPQPTSGGPQPTTHCIPSARQVAVPHTLDPSRHAIPLLGHAAVRSALQHTPALPRALSALKPSEHGLDAGRTLVPELLAGEGVEQLSRAHGDTGLQCNAGPISTPRRPRPQGREAATQRNATQRNATQRNTTTKAKENTHQHAQHPTLDYHINPIIPHPKTIEQPSKPSPHSQGTQAQAHRSSQQVHPPPTHNQQPRATQCSAVHLAPLHYMYHTAHHDPNPHT